MRCPKRIPHAVSWTLAVVVVIAVGAAASVGPEGSPTSVSPGWAADTIKVSIVFTGLGGSKGFDSPDACPGASRQGSDAMTGKLVWTDYDAEDGSVLYTGRLARATLFDLCEVKQTLEGDKWCTDRLTGSSQMDVSLEVYGDERGRTSRRSRTKNRRSRSP